jgi:ABC-type multidrug transport system ATPase subunit
MLTPEEHLQIFCIFKGVDPSKIPEQIDQTMKDVDLTSKAGAYSKNLSGG